MTTPNLVDNPELYDVIVLAGVTSPGVVSLSGHDRKVNWDIKAGNAQSGASTSVKDIPPIEFTCSFYLADAEDFVAWPDFVAIVNGLVTGTHAKAVDIYHPYLAENGIKSVSKAMVGGAVPDQKGGETRVIKFLEYLPPKPAGGSPSGSKGKKEGEADPDAAAKAQLADLTKKYQNTPWG